MFTRLFGHTNQEQLRYLQPRVIITAIWLIVIIVVLVTASITRNEPMMLIIALYFVIVVTWVWNLLKGLFGAALGGWFFGSIVVGIVIALFGGIILGMIALFIAALGILRYVYLMLSMR